MNFNKRTFLKASAASVATMTIAGQTLTSSSLAAASNVQANTNKNQSSALKTITNTVKGISKNERFERISHAQKLMHQLDISALILEPGAAMDYFSGVQWWRSERLTAVIIPREGNISVVCPFFEEPSVRESLAVGDDIRVWQEHESPFILIQKILKDAGLDKGKVAFENSVRYFVMSGIMAQLSHMQHVSAEPVTRGCRMYKSQHELELMHKANEVTLLAYADVFSKLKAGMSQSDVKSLMHTAQGQLGGKGAWNMALFNQASAYPHGTKQKQTLTEGSVVLMDCGCNVHGYQSDISRTFVFGEPSKRQRDVWQTVRQGQEIAFEQAKIGTQAGLVDDAVREFYQSKGFGPGYKLPGLSHRTGHGIGMEGHESVNFVHGETAILKPGMCFSNEPGIYIQGEFGVRLEDCIYMTKKGPQWFTMPPSSLDDPIGKLIKLSTT
ncbi:M24 family metallopeptidase [Cognaticolwellia beringensis]|uniref:Aminopeptidase P family protein n=1 Tax=Cognaticolwellia beringensis TaxID=1967665 RepID=A0A222G4U1_9GAMM|nr:Xaa-Pro peptidase family protein [Cognaticolwellia beringensis]ASP46752.1 aminopeptidase P family protein [Cognaticolwellia beringensis]